MPRDPNHQEDPAHRLRSNPDRTGSRIRFLRQSGMQILREEGVSVVLVNSNPATIMTDPETADAVYIEPLLPEIVEAVRMAREALVTYAPQLVREIKIS